MRHRHEIRTAAMAARAQDAVGTNQLDAPSFSWISVLANLVQHLVGVAFPFLNGARAATAGEGQIGAA